jgi:hypothetical protein
MTDLQIKNIWQYTFFTLFMIVQTIKKKKTLLFYNT